MKTNNKKKVGILTLPITTNYGGILQLFALYKALQNLGYDVKHIRRRWNSTNYSVIHKFKRFIYQNFIVTKFKRFERKYIPNCTPKIESDSDFKKRCNEFDIIVVGSDQVWRSKNTGGVGDNYFLDFSNNKVKKVAYAASFGIDYWDEITPEHTDKVKNCLKDFSVITVREKSGICICHETFGVDAVQVLDPTLLLNSKDYIHYFNLKKSNGNRKILGVYLLDETPEKNKFIDSFAFKYGYTIKRLNKTFLSKFNGILNQDFTKADIKFWLTGIYNSDFVITDSFHGTVFSVIFNIPFYSIDNVQRGSTRFKSLFDYLGISGRLITESEQLDDNQLFNIDYHSINEKLEYLKIDSLKYLRF